MAISITSLYIDTYTPEQDLQTNLSIYQYLQDIGYKFQEFIPEFNSTSQSTGLRIPSIKIDKDNEVPSNSLPNGSIQIRKERWWSESLTEWYFLGSEDEPIDPIGNGGLVIKRIHPFRDAVLLLSAKLLEKFSVSTKFYPPIENPPKEVYWEQRGITLPVTKWYVKSEGEEENPFKPDVSGYYTLMRISQEDYDNSTKVDYNKLASWSKTNLGESWTGQGAFIGYPDSWHWKGYWKETWYDITDENIPIENRPFIVYGAKFFHIIKVYEWIENYLTPEIYTYIPYDSGGADLILSSSLEEAKDWADNPLFEIFAGYAPISPSYAETEVFDEKYKKFSTDIFGEYDYNQNLIEFTRHGYIEGQYPVPFTEEIPDNPLYKKLSTWRDSTKNEYWVARGTIQKKIKYDKVDKYGQNYSEYWAYVKDWDWHKVAEETFNRTWQTYIGISYWGKYGDSSSLLFDINKPIFDTEISTLVDLSKKL